MSIKSQDYNELSRLIWKEYASWSHDEKELTELFKEDEMFWHHLGNQYVESICEDIGDIYSYLENASEKARKKILKILVKEYFRMYKIEPIKTSQINLMDEEWKTLKIS